MLVHPDLITSIGVPHPAEARKRRRWPWAMAGCVLLVGCGGRTPPDWVPEAGVDRVRAAPSPDLAAASNAAAKDVPADPARRDAGSPETARDADFVPSDCGGGRFDPWTGLCWQHPRSAEVFDEDGWQRAVDYCEGLSLGGADDWVLPRLFDLLDILGNCTLDYECDPCASSARCTTLFGRDGASYWTSTTSSPTTGDAWTVSFSDGTSYYNYGRPDRLRVRCVRRVS